MNNHVKSPDVVRFKEMIFEKVKLYSQVMLDRFLFENCNLETLDILIDESAKTLIFRMQSEFVCAKQQRSYEVYYNEYASLFDHIKDKLPSFVKKLSPVKFIKKSIPIDITKYSIYNEPIDMPDKFGKIFYMVNNSNELS
jgi:hypothetical protein